MDKQISGLLKQNESIYGSLKAKNLADVLGELVIPDISLSQEEQKDFLLKENARLKELVKASKPPDEPKIPKETKPQVSKPKEPRPDNDDQEDDEDIGNLEPPPPKFSVIANMEDLKRAFFSGEYTQFEELIKANPYKFFTANYKYASDKDGAPEYSARNLVKGFVRSFDDYRKYFMICFRCMQNPETVSNPTMSTYSYPSIWIVNTNDPINSILGSVSEDYDFVEITNEQLISDLLINIRKMNEETPGLIGEAYVH